ncbi:hypothetical protein BV25DRAFT_1990357, partial [Artomyces pyxidatus]
AVWEEVYAVFHLYAARAHPNYIPRLSNVSTSDRATASSSIHPAPLPPRPGRRACPERARPQHAYRRLHGPSSHVSFPQFAAPPSPFDRVTTLPSLAQLDRCANCAFSRKPRHCQSHTFATTVHNSSSSQWGNAGCPRVACGTPTRAWTGHDSSRAFKNSSSTTPDANAPVSFTSPPIEPLSVTRNGSLLTLDLLQALCGPLPPCRASSHSPDEHRHRVPRLRRPPPPACPALVPLLHVHPEPPDRRRRVRLHRVGPLRALAARALLPRRDRPGPRHDRAVRRRAAHRGRAADPAAAHRRAAPDGALGQPDGQQHVRYSDADGVGAPVHRPAAALAPAERHSPRH